MTGGVRPKATPAARVPLPEVARSRLLATGDSEAAGLFEASMKRPVKLTKRSREVSSFFLSSPRHTTSEHAHPPQPAGGVRANGFRVGTIIKLAPSRHGEVRHSSIRALISGLLSPAHGKIRMEEPRSL